MADLLLIEESLKLLVEWSEKFIPLETVYIPRVGCGNGRLNWDTVRPLLSIYLNDKFIVVDITGELEV
jgi:hypothetical protein